MNGHFHLPPELEPYRQQFLATVRPFIKIQPQAAGETTPWQSKIGGHPYLPAGMEFPANNEYRELFFLAQINFAETPRLPPFPEKGILQFYINDDGLYGASLREPFIQDNFKVLFFDHPVMDESLLQTDFSWMRYFGEDSLPVGSEHSYPLHFELSEEAVPLSDSRVVELLGDDFFGRFGEGQWDIMDAYMKLHKSGGHKMGGYAFFTQQDPRYRLGPMELLFQLDSDQAIGCLWGDMGVGNFFIQKEALEKLDFSRVMYHWDCY